LEDSAVSAAEAAASAAVVPEAAGKSNQQPAFKTYTQNFRSPELATHL
jgi:hypothetical protein